MRCSDSKQFPKLICFSDFLFDELTNFQMHNQHSNPIDAEFKKIVPFSQTNKIELLLVKATFKLF